MRLMCLAALIAATYAWTAIAAQEGVQVGLLACALGEQASSRTDDPAGTATRQALCTFKAKNGAQEKYVGNVQLVQPLATHKVTLLWRVRVAPAISAAPGFLEQNYAADSRKLANRVLDLVGETNSRVVLQSMADRKEGSARAKKRSPREGVTVLRVELKLKSTTG
jgi:hypothetical protein